MPEPGTPDAGPLDYLKSYPQQLSSQERDRVWDDINRGIPLDSVLQALVATRVTVRAEPPVPSLDALKQEIKALYSEYDTILTHEFGRLDADVKRAFKDEGKNYGEDDQRYYRALRPFYVKAGVYDPPSWLNALRSISFLGIKVRGVQSDFAGTFQKAEGILGTLSVQGGRDLKLEIENAIRKTLPKDGALTAFVPRTINRVRDPSDNLSNHGRGTAVDIDAGGNPRVAGAAAADADAVFSWLLSQRDAGVDWMSGMEGTAGPWSFSEPFIPFAGREHKDIEIAVAKMQDNSRWVQHFLRTWLARRKLLQQNAAAAKKKLKTSGLTEDEAKLARDEIVLSENLEKLIRALSKTDPPIKAETVAKQGLMTLSASLFRAMAEAGARSGLEYVGQKPGKDPMHFEILLAGRPARRLRAPR